MIAMTLVPFDSPLWNRYTGAYGNVCMEVRILLGDVADIPPQGKLNRFDTADKDDYRIAFDNLCENLWHQMGFYDGLYLVLPYMVTLLERKKADNDFAWQLAIISSMGICLATDSLYNGNNTFTPEAILGSYHAAIKKLQDEAKIFLQTYQAEISALDRAIRIWSWPQHYWRYLMTG